MVSNASTASHYTWGGVCEGWRLVDQDDLSVIRERVPPGAGERRHLHHCPRQAFIVLSGELEIEVDGGSVTLGEGDAVEVEAGHPHSVRNTGATDAWFLVVSAPTTRHDRLDLEP